MGQPMRELTPYRSAWHFFGAELRLRRLAAGLSQAALAPKVFTSPAMLNKVELAQRFPSADLAVRCDEGLHADGALIRLHALAVAERAAAAVRPPAPVELAPSEAVALLRLLAGLSSAATGHDRPDASLAGLLDRIDQALGGTAVPTRAHPSHNWTSRD